MPGTVKSGLLTDADKLYKCDRQGNEKNIILPLDKGHFITGHQDPSGKRNGLLSPERWG